MAYADRRPIGLDARRHGRDALLLCPHGDPERVPPHRGGGRSARRCAAGYFRARGHAFRLAERPLWPIARAGLVDSYVLRPYGLYRHIAEHSGTDLLARRGWRRAGRGMGGRGGAGGRDMAGPASREGDRADAVGLGGGLSAGRSAGRGGASPVGLAAALPRRNRARAGHALDPAQYPRAAPMAATFA